MSAAIAQAGTARSPAAASARYRNLLAAGHLLVLYQPIVDLRAGAVLGVEALARLVDGNRVAFPVAFLDKLGVDALRTMLFSSLTQGLALLSSCAASHPDLTLAINVHSSVLLQRDFAASLGEVIDSSATDARRITLELLETARLRCPKTARRQIEELRERGFGIALDDVGSAYSSLLRLKELPVDAIKLDQGFVRGLTHEPEDLRFVSSMMSLARGLRKRLVIEGVETPEILDALRVMGVEAAQGYGIAPPMPAELLSLWLSDYRPTAASRKPCTLLGAYASHLGVIEACDALSNQSLKFIWLNAADPHACDIGRFFDQNGLHETALGIAHKNFHLALPHYETDRENWAKAEHRFRRALRDAIQNQGQRREPHGKPRRWSVGSLPMSA